MEIYVAYKDYNWMMDFTEQMIERVANDVCGSTEIQVGDNKISLKAPFKRISMRDSILEFTGFDINGKSENELRAAAKGMGIEVNETMGKGKLIDEIFGEKCEGNYIQPTFITDYPIEMSPLCKKHRENPELTERFELMINGKEVANAYSELNDPIDQRERFEEQLRLSEKGDDEAMFIDQDFLRALEYGMPPTSGMGIGIDRLVMLLTNNSSIQEVLFFPQMRPEKFQTGPDLKAFQAIGVSTDWAEHVYKAGFSTITELLDAKPTAVHQKLNGYRKKNKLEIPALLIEEVESWYHS
jgi:lysyl-tRNA synthetase class 2